MTDQESSASIWRHPAFATVLFAVFLGAIDLTVVATILPSMIGDLGINTADIDRYIWAVNGYLIAYVVSIPLFGRVSDIIGIRAAFISASAIFIVGSLWCALAGSLQDLIIGRAVQGFGGGALLPIALSVAAASFSGINRNQAIGAVGAIDTFGWVSGPAYGALMTSRYMPFDEPWRMVFWINIPITAILIMVAWNILAPTASEDQSRSIPLRNWLYQLDLTGFALLSMVLVSMNLALASGGEIGATAGRGLRAFGGTPNPVADYIPHFLVIAAIAILLLVVWIRHSDDPFIPRQLLRIAHYRASLTSNFLLGTVLMTGMVNVPVIVALIETSTETATTSALLLAPFTATIAVFSIVSGRLMSRYSAGTVTMMGLALALTGNLAIYPLLEQASYEWMTVGLAIAGTGIGLALTPLSSTALSSASRSTRGAAASTLLVFRLLGMTVGVSVLTSLGVQRLQILTGDLDPITQAEGESTAEFLLRQQDYIITHAIPLGVQVVQETFLAAALLTAIALIPGWYLLRHRRDQPSES